MPSTAASMFSLEPRKFAHLFLYQVTSPLQIIHRWRKATHFQDDGLREELSCNLLSFNMLKVILKTTTDPPMEGPPWLTATRARSLTTIIEIALCDTWCMARIRSKAAVSQTAVRR